MSGDDNVQAELLKLRRQLEYLLSRERQAGAAEILTDTNLEVLVTDNGDVLTEG